MPSPSDMVAVILAASAADGLAVLSAQAIVDGSIIAPWTSSEGIGWD